VDSFDLQCGTTVWLRVQSQPIQITFAGLFERRFLYGILCAAHGLLLRNRHKITSPLAAQTPNALAERIQAVMSHPEFADSNSGVESALRAIC
jgi:hypothetical protein